MLKNYGKFIVIEGIDGSGKKTQLDRLANYFNDRGVETEKFDFPQYDRPSSYFVKKYLNGEYGGIEDVSSYQASIFYALDRFDIKQRIQKTLKLGKIVISNRYVASNMAHQGSKIDDFKERKKYFEWVNTLEYDILGIPRPDLNLVLMVSSDLVQNLVAKKGARNYVKDKSGMDAHESNLSHLKRSESIYRELIERFPDQFKEVECVANQKLLSIDEISKKLITIVNEIIK